MRLFTLTRLVTAEGRGASGRLIGMAGGIAVGVALLLLLLGGYDGVTSRSERLSWPSLSHGESTELRDPAAAAPTDESVLAATNLEHFDGQEIIRVDIVATPDSTVVVPGVGRPPAAGTYHASPALIALIEANPTDTLGSRYGTRAGVIDTAGLAGPDSLVVVTGTTTENLRPSIGMVGSVFLSGNVWSVTEFRGVSYPSSNYRAITIIGAIAILLPVLILVGIVTRLGAATRAERFAALRLIGATPRRVAAIAATETGVTSLVGALAGVALAWLLIPVAALVEVEDGRFFRADLTVPPSTVLIVVAGVVAGCTAVAGWRTSRARIGPLGGSRERTERRPSALGVVPLIAGVVVLLGATTAALRHGPLPRTDRILIAGFLLLLVGLIAAGPVLTYWIARIAARRAHRTAGVIAMNRIQQHPRATFRAVSGLVAAVFLVSFFSAGITTLAEESPTEDSEYLAPSTLIAWLDPPPPDDAGTAASGTTAVTAATSRIARTDGVTATAIGYSHPEAGAVFAAADATRAGLPTPDGASHIQVTGSAFGDGSLVTRPATAPGTTPEILLVATDGTTHSVERARTAILGSELRLSFPPMTQSDHESARWRTWADRYANLGHLAVLVATLISAVSLAVSSIAAILDRKRVLGLLRLMGMPASTVRRVIVAEAALPLATVFALCVGLGILTAWCIVAGLTEGERTINWLPPSYYLILATSLALAATAVIATFRTARTSTTIEATRIG
ncbi:ABC transporter permease [Salinispora sp. H7-4]|uniref:ABC transporter permease n=1 Tax=Salinispora sp. H7-4 TaxID=2748321 RepID=UPI0015D2BD32|nr:ABC transporter permease [Salinispora sp. H7-4]NYT93835.1 ABC transporter permease [Salinispora sp. H7-4]